MKAKHNRAFTVSDKIGHRNCVNLRNYNAMFGGQGCRFDAVYHGIVVELPQSREVAASVSNPVRVATSLLGQQALRLILDANVYARCQCLNVFAHMHYSLVFDRLHVQPAGMEIRTVRDIGALIRDRRNQLKLTQEDLAMRVGASRLWVVQLEKGKSTAQISLVLRALRELGVILDGSIHPHAAAKDRPATTIDLDAIIDRAKSAKP